MKTGNDTKNRIKAILKEKYPNTKFRMIKRHTSLDVEWFDGPTLDEVEKITNQFEGCSFDGMIDLESYVRDSDYKYIFPRRELSEQSRNSIIDKIKNEWGLTSENSDNDFQKRTGALSFENFIYRLSVNMSF